MTLQILCLQGTQQLRHVTPLSFQKITLLISPPHLSEFSDCLGQTVEVGSTSGHVGSAPNPVSCFTFYSVHRQLTCFKGKVPVAAVTSSKWMLHTGGGWGETFPPPHMIVKCFGCTATHNKALYKCIIHSFIQVSKVKVVKSTVSIWNNDGVKW